MRILNLKKRIILNALGVSRRMNSYDGDEIQDNGELLGYVEETDDTYGKAGWGNPVYKYNGQFFVLTDLKVFGPYNSENDVENKWGKITDDY